MGNRKVLKGEKGIAMLREVKLMMRLIDSA